MLRECYSGTWRLYADLSITTGGYYLRCPQGTPAYPGYTNLGSRNWCGEQDEVPEESLGESISAPQPWYSGAPPVIFPSPIQVGSADCIENGERIAIPFARPKLLGITKWDDVDQTGPLWDWSLQFPDSPDCGVTWDSRGGLMWEASFAIEGTLDCTVSVNFDVWSSDGFVGVYNGLSWALATSQTAIEYQCDQSDTDLCGSVRKQNVATLPTTAITRGFTIRFFREASINSLNGYVGERARVRVTFTPAAPTTPLIDGFPVACYGAALPPADSLDIKDWDTQVKIAEIQALVYTDMAAAEAKALALLPMSVVTTWPIDDDPASGMLIATDGVQMLTVVSGTTDVHQLALQMASYADGPRSLANFLAPAVYQVGGRTVASRMMARGAATQRLTMVGHSMGGALVATAAGQLMGLIRRLPNQQFDVHLLTFGAPKFLTDLPLLPDPRGVIDVVKLPLRERLRFTEQLHFVNYLDGIPQLPLHGLWWIDPLNVIPGFRQVAVNFGRMWPPENRMTLFADGAIVAGDPQAILPVIILFSTSWIAGLNPVDPVVAEHAMETYHDRLILSQNQLPPE